jgi:SGF29 tudor-like domain
VEEAEDGQPGQSVPIMRLLHSYTAHCLSRSYNTTLRSLIPLPDPSAPPNSAIHPNSYEEYAVGSIVMGLYPDTSCFYRAEVVAAPRDSQPGSRVSLCCVNDADQNGDMISSRQAQLPKTCID